MIDGGNFLIHEPERNPFAREKERILKCRLQENHYLEYMNRQLYFKFQQIDLQVIEKYLGKVIGRTI